MIRAFALLLVLATPAAAAEISGPVDHVADGDTLTIGHTRIRLCGIQAPERKDRGGAASTRALERLVRGRELRCIPVGEGTPCDGRSRPTSYDRIVAQCFVGWTDLAAAMVAAGRARDWSMFSGGVYRRSGR